MSNRAHIEKELQSIAPGLLPMPVAMPYTLPSGYFAGLASQLLTSVQSNGLEPFLTFGKVLPYTVPEGYFEQLADTVLQKLKAEEADEPLLSVDSNRTTPYTIPQGYFESFPEIVLQKAIDAASSQTVPAGYFESLPEQLLAKVRKLDTSKELEEVAPLLNTISKQPVQHIPMGYFDGLLPIMGGKMAEQPALVVKNKPPRNWLRYAVAASIVFLLGTGTYFVLNNKPEASGTASQPAAGVINEQLAKLDASTIESYLQQNNAAVQMALPGDNLEELNTLDLDKLLQSFTDQQLKKYIDETPELPTAGSSNHPS